jgi:hypothetical protein
VREGVGVGVVCVCGGGGRAPCQQWLMGVCVCVVCVCVCVGGGGGGGHKPNNGCHLQHVRLERVERVLAANVLDHAHPDLRLPTRAPAEELQSPLQLRVKDPLALVDGQKVLVYIREVGLERVQLRPVPIEWRAQQAGVCTFVSIGTGESKSTCAEDCHPVA